MIWLASFPRSGNTFFRIVLHEVYGIASSEFHMETRYPVDPDYANHAVVKTHLLPSQLLPNNHGIPAVYIVRDGRDALVSIAHHRKDIIAPGSDFETNLREAVIAEKGSFFGGWSQNVLQWLERASIVIRFEDLIIDPIACTERLRKIMDLPEPQSQNLPTFGKLRNDPMPYEFTIPSQEREQWRKKFFRRGKVGTWKEEMPYGLHELFWKLHGHAMECLGYEKEIDLDLPKKNLWFYMKSSLREMLHNVHYLGDTMNTKKKVLIEASEIMMGANDGCQRYVFELLRALLPIAKQRQDVWEIDVHVGMRSMYNILDVAHLILPEPSDSDQSQNVRKTDVKFKAISIILRIESSVFNTIKATLPETLVLLLQERKRGLQAYLWNHFPSLWGRFRTTDFGKYDLVHITLPQFYHTVKDSPSATKFVTTVHDLSHRHYPQFHTKNNIVTAEKGMQFTLARSSAYIAVSEATRQDILTEYQVDTSDVYTVYEGCDSQSFYPVRDAERLKQVREKYHIPPATPYLLSLSTLEPRKNLLSMVKAFLLLLQEQPECEAVFVVAGQKGWKYQELFQEQGVQSDRVLFTGFIAEEDLAAIYSGALAFSYISYFEGFGLPLLEAMSCGTPVIYGNNSSMPELVGDAGILAEPDDIEDIKEQFKRVVYDEDFRITFAERALRRAAKFSWEKTAHDTLTVYEKLIIHQT